jgi:hypothetical protein
MLIFGCGHSYYDVIYAGIKINKFKSSHKVIRWSYKVTKYLCVKKRNVHTQDTGNLILKRLKQIHYLIKETELAHDNGKK